MKNAMAGVARAAVWTFGVGLTLLVLVLVLVIPLVLPYAVGRVASQRLGHPVSVRRLVFNPFTFRLTVHDLSIRDNGPDQPEMAGFNDFWVQVDPWRLAHKRLRVTSVGFEGLRVNVALLPGKQINLLSLVPVASPSTPTAAAVAAASTPTAAARPDVEVDSFILRNASINFSDLAIGQGYTLKLAPLDLSVTGFSSLPDAQVNASLKGTVDGQGKLAMDALIRSPLDNPAIEATFSLNQYAAQAISPYTGRYAGHTVREGGRIDFNATYRVSNGKLNAQHRLVIQSFNFGKPVHSKDALHLPFSLALALLKDRHGRIDISLPVAGDLRDPKFRYWGALCKVLLNFLEKLVTAPFTALGNLVPGSAKGPEAQDMGTASFPVGSGSLPPGEQEKLNRMASALKARPELRMEVDGTYDPQEDGLALQNQTLLRLVAAERAKKDAPDLEIYERIFAQKLGDKALQDLQAQAGGGSASEYPSLLKARLLDSLPVTQDALLALAHSRAKALLLGLTAAGARSSQVKAGGVHDTVAALGQVPTDFTLGR